MGKGAYIHKQAKRPRKAVKLTVDGQDGFDQAVKRFFRDRGQDLPPIGNSRTVPVLMPEFKKWVRRKP